MSIAEVLETYDRKIIGLRGNYDEEFYLSRVDRNLGWLDQVKGKTGKSEQEELRDSIIGIAGCGGMGGGVVSRLVRLGVGSKDGVIKIADPEDFEPTNLNRQAACTVDTLGKNKATATAEMAFSITGDCNIDVYQGGVTPDTVEGFVSGCNLIFDLMEFYQLKNRIALHQECRKQGVSILNVDVVGMGNRVYLFTPGSMTIEEFLDVTGDEKVDAELIMRFVQRWAPELPPDITTEKVHDWVVRMHKAPIMATSPAQGEGFITNRAVILLLDWENKKPWIQKLPPMPGYLAFDAGLWRAHAYWGKWW